LATGHSSCIGQCDITGQSLTSSMTSSEHATSAAWGAGGSQRASGRGTLSAAPGAAAPHWAEPQWLFRGRAPDSMCRKRYRCISKCSSAAVASMRMFAGWRNEVSISHAMHCTICTIRYRPAGFFAGSVVCCCVGADDLCMATARWVGLVPTCCPRQQGLQKCALLVWKARFV
jgi:hypothetical protein